MPSPSSQVRKMAPPCWYASEARIFGTSAASQLSPCRIESLAGAHLSCMSLHRSGLMSEKLGSDVVVARSALNRLKGTS